MTHNSSIEIRYNRQTKDYDIYVGSEYIGSASTYHDAENRANVYLLHLIELRLNRVAQRLEEVGL